MEKFIPYEKLSKKKQREIDRKSRRDWNGISPVTRKSENQKAYNRKRHRTDYDFDPVPLLFFISVRNSWKRTLS